MRSEPPSSESCASLSHLVLTERKYSCKLGSLSWAPAIGTVIHPSTSATANFFAYTAKTRLVTAFLQWGLSDGVFGNDWLALQSAAIRPEPLTSCVRIERDSLHSRRNYRTYAGSGENSTPRSQCALPHCGPARRQPVLFSADQRVRPGSAKSVVTAHRYEQFFLAGWVVFYWDLHSRLFGDFAASGAARRRTDRHRDGVDAAEAARR